MGWIVKAWLCVWIVGLKCGVWIVDSTIQTPHFNVEVVGSGGWIGGVKSWGL